MDQKPIDLMLEDRLTWLPGNLFIGRLEAKAGPSKRDSK